MVALRCSLTSDVFRSLDLAAPLSGKTIASTPGCPEGLHASVTAGWTAERAYRLAGNVLPHKVY
jgi:hypothetical protein